MNDLDQIDAEAAADFAAHFAEVRLDRTVDQLRRPRSSRPKVMRRAAVSAAAVVAIVVATVAVNGGGAPAYAYWSPTPRMASPDERAVLVDACNAVFASDPELPADAFDTDAFHEVRGTTGMLIEPRSDGGYYQCVATLADGLGDDNAQVFLYGAPDVVGGVGPWFESGGGPEHHAAFVVGRSEAAVSAEVTVPGVPTATATVVGGWYFVWWPVEEWSPSDRGDSIAPPDYELRLLDAAGAVIEVFTA